MQTASLDTSSVRRRRKALEPDRARHVLLVEDDEEMRCMLAYALHRSGFRVTEACDALQALDRLRTPILDDGPEQRIDLLVTDEQMPGFRGLDLIHSVRSCGILLPAILITGFGSAETHARASRLGETIVLDKPFELDALVTLARRSARRGLA